QLASSMRAVVQEAAFDFLRWAERRTHALLALAQSDRSETPAPDRAGRGHASRSAGSAPVDPVRMGLGLGCARRINGHRVMGYEPAGARAEVLAVLRRKAREAGRIEGGPVDVE